MADAKRAIVLLSGGLDSATALAEASAAGFEVHALSFRYGQRHQIELRMAARQAELQRAKSHRIVEIDLAQFGGSALTTDLPVPQGRAIDEMSSGIPITYVPARNTIFLSFALAHAEVLGAFDIFIGVIAVDYSGYPDCRPEFIRAFQEVANLGTRAGVERPGTFAIRTPLIHLTKAEIIRRGLELGVDYSQTSTCYSPDPATGLSCGKCDACQLRLRGFAEVGINDPVGYQAR